jgi:hypothetical protein
LVERARRRIGILELVNRHLGRLDEARPLYHQSREIMEKLIETHPEVTLYQQGLCHNRLEDAEVILRESGPELALPTLRGAVALAEQTAKAFPDSHGVLRTLAQARIDLADALVDAGRVDEGVKVSAESVRNFDVVLARDGGDEDDIRYQTRLLASLAAAVAANARFEAGRPDREMAEKADRWSAELSAKLAGDPNVDFVRALALDERARVLGLDAATAAEGTGAEVACGVDGATAAAGAGASLWCPLAAAWSN